MLLSLLLLVTLGGQIRADQITPAARHEDRASESSSAVGASRRVSMPLIDGGRIALSESKGNVTLLDL